MSDAVKGRAAALCDIFAHHETGFCNPATFADQRAPGDPRIVWYPG